MRRMHGITVAAIFVVLTGCGGDYNVPCAKIAWAEADGSYRIRVIYERANCIALSEQYTMYREVGELTNSSKLPMLLASNYLTRDDSLDYLKSDDFVDILHGKSNPPFPAFSSAEELPVNFKVASVLVSAAEQGGNGALMLGDIGVFVSDVANGYVVNRIESDRAGGKPLNVEEELMLEQSKKWNQLRQQMQVSGQPAIAAVLRGGLLAIVGRDVPSHPNRSRNIEVKTVDGELTKVNIDYIAIVAMPPNIIDLQVVPDVSTW